MRNIILFIKMLQILYNNIKKIEAEWSFNPTIWFPDVMKLKVVDTMDDDEEFDRLPQPLIDFYEQLKQMKGKKVVKRTALKLIEKGIIQSKGLLEFDKLRNDWDELNRKAEAFINLIGGPDDKISPALRDILTKDTTGNSEWVDMDHDTDEEEAGMGIQFQQIIGSERLDEFLADIVLKTNTFYHLILIHPACGISKDEIKGMGAFTSRTRMALDSNHTDIDLYLISAAREMFQMLLSNIKRIEERMHNIFDY